MKKGGFIRSGSVQRFYGVEPIKRKKRKSNKRGGFIRSGSVQRFYGVETSK